MRHVLVRTAVALTVGITFGLGAVPLASALLNTYTEAAANSTTGQRTYQVIRDRKSVV